MSIQLDGNAFLYLDVKCGGCDETAHVAFHLEEVDAESDGFLHITLGGGLPLDWTVVPFSEEVLCKRCSIEAEREEAEYREESMGEEADDEACD